MEQAKKDTWWSLGTENFLLVQVHAAMLYLAACFTKCPNSIAALKLLYEYDP